MKELTKQKLKYLERISVIISIILPIIFLVIWLCGFIPLPFTKLACLLTYFLTLLFFLYLRFQYKHQSAEFIKKAISYWKSIVILQTFVILGFVIFK